MKSAGFYQETDLELPVSDPGVESDYTIELTGFGDVPAMGSAEAFIGVHAQEARFDFSPLAGGGFGIVKSEDMVYSETTAASGEITLFEKAMGYTSKITAPGAPSSGFD